MKGDHNQNAQRKRKNTEASTQEQQEQEVLDNPKKHQHLGSQQHADSDLDLSLSLPSNPSVTQSEPTVNPSPLPTSSKPQRARRNTTRNRSEGGRKKTKSETVPAPYPWATEKRATVHTLKYLLDNNLNTISDDVQGKKCEKSYTMKFDLQQKFQEIAMFVVQKQDEWHDRAPEEWTAIKLLTCKFCGQEDSCKPLIANKKRNINWLFLLLGQFLGCCTLEQLKYFCKHTNIHRTGAKNRVLLYTYLALCKQLEPDGPFFYQTIP